MTDQNRLATQVASLADAHVLVVGDLMLDRFVSGAVDRISPEAPIPVFQIKDQRLMAGGAGNVAANVVALGGTATLIGVAGDDEAGRQLTELLGHQDRLTARTVVDAKRPTSVKTRYVAQGQQVLRADSEERHAIESGIAAQLLEVVDAALPDAGALVLSDYGKGVLTPDLLHQIIARADAQKIPVVVDPHGRDYARYKQAAYVSPNRAELTEVSGAPAGSTEQILAAAQQVMEVSGVAAMLVTRSEDGMSLIPHEGTATHFSAEAREVYDVSGAGDTVVAAFAAALSVGGGPTDAAALANTAAGIVVTKAGTATVSAAELITHTHEADLKASDVKVRPLDEALRVVAGWRERGLRVGFTNGAFDLLHPGHIASLSQAKSHCDRLVVALNSDASVRGLKGPSRPIQNETARAMVLGAMSQVDLVTIFEEDTPLALIKAIRPDVLVKGGDYSVDQVVGADVVQAYGGTVILADYIDGHSTTRTVSRMAG
jgi:D-beta-D-heptose 7-phosphate kinase/D-beta-D-heptose 1-phosphate adenosyltransferase